MFAKAYEIATQFTCPLLVAVQFYDNTIESGPASFVVLNSDGWIITAAHNYDVHYAFHEHKPQIQEFKEKVEKINAMKNLSDHKRKLLLNELTPNNKWITNFAVMLGKEHIPVEESIVYHEHDIAFLRIPTTAIAHRSVFPKIIDPKKIKYGTSLMKLGYPFLDIKATFNSTKNAFEWTSDQVPTFFPIEGIFTRTIMKGKTQDGTMEIMFLETSSPGLKGQSGGPICDMHGNIYAIQSRNWTVDLGFKGIVEINGKQVEENQFINLGMGVHPATIVSLLDKHKIRYELAS